METVMNFTPAVIKANASCASSAALGAQAQVKVLKEQLAATLNSLRISVERSNAWGYDVDISKRAAIDILNAFDVPIRNRADMGDYVAVCQGNADGRGRVAGTDRLHPGNLEDLIAEPKAA